MAGRLLLFVFILCSRSSLVSGTMWRYSPLVSVCTINGDHLMATMQKTTSGACALECHLRRWCNSFHYTALDRICQLCSLHYLDSDVLIDTGVTKYYRSTSEECPLEEGLIWDRQSGMCVAVMASQKQRVSTWSEAREGCSRYNLSLASLHTPQRLEFLVRSLRHNYRFKNAKADFFIGAARPFSAWGKPWPGNVSDLQWLRDGSPVDVTDRKYWVAEQPDNQLNGDNVIVLKFENDFCLSDDRENASYSLGYVCEKNYQ